MFIYMSIKIPTGANNGCGNAQASIIFMEATLNGEHVFDVSVFILKDTFFLAVSFPVLPSVLGPGSSWQCHSCLLALPDVAFYRKK